MSGIQTEITLEKLKEIKLELDAIKQQMSPVEPFTMIISLEYAEPYPLVQRDNGNVYDTILFTAPSSNTGAVYIGSSNPAYPITAGSSVQFRKKKLIHFYVKGNVGDQLIISA